MRSETLLLVVLGISVGLEIGIGGFTFVYAKGASYLTDDPRACANCHVMSEQFDGWKSILDSKPCGRAEEELKAWVETIHSGPIACAIWRWTH